jgi:Tol biopolymer transport system component
VLPARLLLATAAVLVASPGAGAHVDAKPRGKIVFSGGSLGSTDIYTVRADGSHFRQLTNTPVTEQSPSWAPDGKSFVYVKAEGNGSIYRMKAGGGRPRLLFKEGNSGGAIIQYPAWSPDGRRIAFTSARLGGTWTIWTYGLDGRLVEVTRTLSDHPTWSPNGRQIAYSSQYGVSIVGFRGGRPRPVPHTSSSDAYPVWSPDGKWIAVRSLNPDWRQHEVDSLDVVNPAGTVRKRVLSGGRISPQSWSPTSDAILVSRAFGKPGAGQSQLFIVPLDGGRPRPVDGTNGANGASWHR